MSQWPKTFDDNETRHIPPTLFTSPTHNNTKLDRVLTEAE